MSTRQPNDEQLEAQEISLLVILQTLVKRKFLILKVCTLAVVASVAYSLYLPNIYSATARVLPPQKEGGGSLSAMLGQMGALAGMAPGSLGAGADLYLGLLKSRSVADAVVADLNLQKVYQAKSAEDARGKLAGALKVQAGKDGIILITAEDRDPKMAAALANATAEALGRTTVRLNLSKAGTERTFLERRLELVKRDLNAAEEDLKQFSQKNRVVQVDAQAKASIEGVARLKAEIASREVQLSALRTSRTDESPEVQNLQSAIRRLNREVASRVGSGGDSEGIPAVGSVPGVGLEYARKMRELKTQEAIYEQLMKQYEMAKLSEAKDSSSIQILDQAVAPLKRSKPKRAQIVITSTFMGFVFSLLIVFGLERLESLSETDRKRLHDIRNRALSWRSLRD